VIQFVDYAGKFDNITFNCFYGQAHAYYYICGIQAMAFIFPFGQV